MLLRNLAIIMTLCLVPWCDEGQALESGGSQSAPPAERAAQGLARERERLLRYWTENYQPPRDYVVAKFREKKWIVLGEYHRVKHDVELVSSLIPELHEKTSVRRLALEFLCRDRTGEANALVTAKELERHRVLEFFRLQFPAWSYEEYVDILETTWESNQMRSAERGPFLLVGLHPCPDRELMHYGTDSAAIERERIKQERYDEIMAEAIEEELLEKDLEALIYTGIAHATGKYPEYWVGTEKQLVRMGNLIYKEPYTREMFFVALHAPFYAAARDEEIYPFDGILDELMISFQRDIGFDVVGTPFAALGHRDRAPFTITEFEFGELFDGYIMHRTPIKEYKGVTCIEDWIRNEEEFTHFWRNLSSKSASERFSKVPFAEFKQDRCSPRPDHGVEFRKRFRKLPDL